MDVDFEDLVVVADDQGIADAVQIQAQRHEIHIRVVLAHDVHSVENVLLRHLDLLGAPGGLDLGRGGGAHLAGLDLPAQRGEDRVQDHNVALAARVDHTGLLENRVLVHGVLQGIFPGVNGGGQTLLQAGAVPGGLDRGGGGQAGDGQNGALGGLHHGFIGGLDTVVHRAGKLGRAGGLQPLQAAGDAAEEQGEDDAGVAARPAQHGARHALRGGGHGVKVLLAQLGGGVVDGQPHIGAGVPVGDRKNIQIVDGLDIRVQCRVRTEDHLFEGCGIDILSHGLRTSIFYPIIVSTKTSTLLTGIPVAFCSLYCTSLMMLRQAAEMLMPWSTPMCSSSETLSSSL